MTPSTSVMLYDGDCGFCQQWVNRWQQRAGAAIRFAPYQEARVHYPQVSEAQCQEAVQLVTSEGRVFSGAHAVFHALAAAPFYRLLLWAYHRLPLFGRLAEGAYQWVAHHRMSFSNLTRDSTKKCW